MTIVNALSIDVEDYFQVSAFEHVVAPADWDSVEHRVERNIDRLLGMLDELDSKATFFTLGWLAKRYPDMIRRIVLEGHELASHGYRHQRVSDLTPQAFRSDLVKTKGILEDLGGVEVLGYRAPSYSINDKNIWALEILAETGHIYSSSIYPGKHDHYGYPGAPRFVFKDKKTGLVEIPVTTAMIFNTAIPAGGGGFFRFYPYQVSRWLINTVNRNEAQAAMFYLHPWEIDPEQPRQSNLTFKTRFRHYVNLDKTETRLRQLLADFTWRRVDEVFLRDREILTHTLS